MAREEELIKRIVQGDADAAEELIRMFYSEILRYCAWYMSDESLAADAAQETFLKAIRYFDRYSNKGGCRPFLYKVAANTCIDLLRKRRTEMPLEKAEEAVYTEAGFLKIQSDLTLRQIIGGLSKELQEVILLRYGQDMTIREISEATHLPLRTVQSRIRRALQKLKKEYEKGDRL